MTTKQDIIDRAIEIYDSYTAADIADIAKGQLDMDAQVLRPRPGEQVLVEELVAEGVLEHLPTEAYVLSRRFATLGIA